MLKTVTVTLTAEVQVDIEIERDEDDDNLSLSPWEEDLAANEADEVPYIDWRVTAVDEAG